MFRLYIGLLAVVLIFAGSVLSAPFGSEVPQEIRYATRMGEIVFSHADHERWVADCATCHHEGGFVKCAQCHDGQPGMRKKTDALHMQCQGCHRDQGLSTQCTDCHSR